MPHGHHPGMPQVTAVDGQFGTHRIPSPRAGVRCTTSHRVHPVGLEYRILVLTCRFMGTRIRSCCDLILTGEPAEDRSAANLVVGQVDHVWWLGLGLSWCELCERSVWPGLVEMV
jgi:hypothetical protein